jgi:SAM-dependent methyltransferase
MNLVCPDCRTVLVGLYCDTCRTQFAESNGIPVLLPRDRRLASIGSVGAVYDNIYDRRGQVWEDQGRTPEFIHYFANLAASCSSRSVLEIGCGEGFLLRALRAEEKAAIDISAAAVRRASAGARATFCVAAAERLPFPDGRFDLVLSVGVMEHFIDDHEATAEVWRVLRSGGYYLNLIHTDLTIGERIRQKVREYLFPTLRLRSFARWIGSKVYRPVRQPIQRKYTLAAGRECLEQCGLHVVQAITLTSNPGIPLVGPHVVIYVARK